MDFKKLIESEEYNFLRENERLKDNTILLTLGGSHAYGTNNENSDVDVRGIYLPTARDLLGNYTFKEQKPFENHDTDTTIYELRHIVKLLSECNPNVIEILATHPDHIIKITPEGKLLRDKVNLFLSKNAANSFGGYATAQLKRLENALARDQYDSDEKERHILVSVKNVMRGFVERYGNFGLDDGFLNLYIGKYIDKSLTLAEVLALDESGELKEQILIDISLRGYPLRDLKGMYSEMNNVITEYGKLNHRNNKKDDLHLNKHAMHLYRLLIMGSEILEGKPIKTYRDEEHDLLMDIRNGKYSENKFKPFFELVQEATKRFEYAEANTSLPNKPDYEAISDLLMTINKFVVCKKGICPVWDYIK